MRQFGRTAQQCSRFWFCDHLNDLPHLSDGHSSTETLNQLNPRDCAFVTPQKSNASYIPASRLGRAIHLSETRNLKTTGAGSANITAIILHFLSHPKFGGVVDVRGGYSNFAHTYGYFSAWCASTTYWVVGTIVWDCEKAVVLLAEWENEVELWPDSSTSTGYAHLFFFRSDMDVPSSIFSEQIRLSASRRHLLCSLFSTYFIPIGIT